MFEDVQFIFLDMSTALVQAWKKAFTEHLDDSIHEKFTFLNCKLEDIPPPHDKFDCIVSPANSYGRLDGGFDYYLSEALAPSHDHDAPTRHVQSVLYREWRGYAPPGTCTMISLLNSPCESNVHGCSYIGLCPTMRFPEEITWNREVIYNCMWSLLVQLDKHNTAIQAGGGAARRIRSVVIPGLGTGIGEVPIERCAQQMALAFREFLLSAANPGKWSSLSWDDATENADDTRVTYGSPSKWSQLL